MLEYYLPIRGLHICLVLASGALFATRGLLVLAGRSALANHQRIRLASYVMDSLLLAAALLLVWMLQLAVLSTSWLQAKLALLVVYIVLGSLALRRARSTLARRLCFGAALATYLFMLGVARAHHPLGWFSL